MSQLGSREEKENAHISKRYQRGFEPGCDNQFPNRDCQRGALRCAPVRKDAVTSGSVSGLFTVYLDDKVQTILVIVLQFTLSKSAKQCILTIIM